MNRAGPGILVATLVLAGSLPAATPAEAQISPGDLSRPHADLSGSTRCLSCHGSQKSEMDGKCLDCHTPIRTLREQSRGLHGLEPDRACAECHPEHAGEDFELIDWGKPGLEGFDHSRAGWMLEGKHASTECRACHTTKFQTGPVAELMGWENRAGSWLGLETSCTHCHEDAHRGALGGRCLDCHAPAAWKPASNFDHARTAFSLEGKHRDVECAKCHASPRLDLATDAAGNRVPLYKPLPHADCANCHEDSHEGRLAGTCASCHTVTGFKEVGHSGFSHVLTRFPLKGKHAGLECARCHDPVTGWGRRPSFDRCADCHADPHAGQATLAGAPVDCAFCHHEKAFTPAVFSPDQHSRTEYPLEGKHREATCAGCHRPREAQGVVLGSAGVDMRPAHDRCRDCHAEAHGAQWRDRPEYADCAVCHTPAGFRPSLFGPEAHARLTLPLEGRHLEISCSSCHGAGRTGLLPLPEPSERGSAGVWLRMGETPCETCHVDPHRPTEDRESADIFRERACRDCHSPEGFRPSAVTVEAHAVFSFPLEGSHQTVPCAACHEELSRPRLENTLVLAAHEIPNFSFSLRRGRCGECHESPHGIQFMEPAGDPPCSRCHGVEMFTPADRFDHSRDTRFPLTGAHSGVECRACHSSRRVTADREVTVYRPTPVECASCHGEGKFLPGQQYTPSDSGSATGGGDGKSGGRAP